jgi:hypothetical protein
MKKYMYQVTSAPLRIPEILRFECVGNPDEYRDSSGEVFSDLTPEFKIARDRAVRDTEAVIYRLTRRVEALKALGARGMPLSEDPYYG